MRTSLDARRAAHADEAELHSASRAALQAELDAARAELAAVRAEAEKAAARSHALLQENQDQHVAEIAAEAAALPVQR